ncbi:MAG: hypothetical protein AB7E81_01095 [Hyphomicrobiaceae bacterium]
MRASPNGQKLEASPSVIRPRGGSFGLDFDALTNAERIIDERANPMVNPWITACISLLARPSTTNIECRGRFRAEALET